MESKSTLSGKFLNVVLEKNGDQLDQFCETWKVLHEVTEYPTYNKKEANWIGHTFRRNYLLKQVTEGKIEGGIEVM